MAEFEQTYHALAESESQEARCQLIQLAERRGVSDALSRPFLIEAYIDGHTLSATAETAKEALARAVEWRVVGKLSDVSINNGTTSYSIFEFASVMALAELANTINNDIDANNS